MENPSEEYLSAKILAGEFLGDLHREFGIPYRELWKLKQRILPPHYYGRYPRPGRGEATPPSAETRDPNRELTPAEIADIRGRFWGGESVFRIAHQMNLPQHIVKKIVAAAQTDNE